MCSPGDDFQPAKLKIVDEHSPSSSPSTMKVKMDEHSPNSSPSTMKVKNTFLNFEYNEDDTAALTVGRSLTWNAVLPRVDSVFWKNSFTGQQLGVLAEAVNEEDVLRVHLGASSSQAPAPLPTTMMLRNFPRRNAQKRLLSHLDTSGFEGAYDFVYLPFCFVTKQNLGYAFINFRTAEKAAEFARVWHKRKAPTGEDHEKKSRVMTVGVALVQGREANVQRILKECNAGKIKNEKFQPVLLDETGKRVDFTLVMQEHRANRAAAAAVSSAAAPTKTPDA